MPTKRTTPPRRPQAASLQRMVVLMAINSWVNKQRDRVNTRRVS